MGVARASLGCGERDPRQAGSDEDRSSDIASFDPLPEPTGADGEQDEQAEGEQGLDESERRKRQRQRLQAPTAEAERRAGKPARLEGKPAKEREPEGVFAGSRPRLQRLQHDPGAVECGRRRGRRQSEKEPGHGQTPP